MAKYSEATPEILGIAEDLIAEYHGHLSECHIGFVLRDEAGTSGGKTVVAHTTKVPEKLKPHLQDELDILIVISEDVWTDLDSQRRRAVIDHELCHVVIRSGKYSLQAHDVEEFRQILERYGLWNGDLLSVGRAMEKAVQLEMGELLKTRTGVVVSVNPAAMAGIEEKLEE